MLDEYNLGELKPRNNPYADKVKDTIAVCVENKTVAYFEKMAAELNVPFQTLINLYLKDCVDNQRQIHI